jgi:hypothetical protein
MSGNPDEIKAVQPDEDMPHGKLPYGIVQALNNAGITTYSQLSNYSPEAIMLLPGMTRAALTRIEAELARRNLRLGPSEAVAPFNPTLPSPGPLLDNTPPWRAAGRDLLRDQFAMAALMNTVFARTEIRTLERQQAWIESCIARRKAILVEQGPSDKVMVDKSRGVVRIMQPVVLTMKDLTRLAAQLADTD